MDFLTVKETAEILKVSPLTVRRYISRNILHAKRVGRTIRIPRSELERWGEHATPEFETLGSSPIKGQPFTEDDPLWSIIGMDTPTEMTDRGAEGDTRHHRGQPAATKDPVPAGKSTEQVWRPTSKDDSIWRIADLVDDDGPTDASANIHNYIADAIEDWHR